MPKPNQPADIIRTRTQFGAPTECWEWKGYRNKQGYGVAWIAGKLRKASHLALEVSDRPRVGRAHALHSCDNPPCVNPAHLRWGTIQDNVDDKMARNRHRNPKGIMHPRSHRTLKVIKVALSHPGTAKQAGAAVGVSEDVINAVRAEHGQQRKAAPPMTFTNKVYAFLRERCDENGLVGVSQTDVARALGCKSSHVNRSIRYLDRDGRLARVGQGAQKVWTYRIL